MYPTIETALKELEIGYEINPTRWVDHCKYAGEAARNIAHAAGLDSEKAYVLGTLHDIGRRVGFTGIRHIVDGYNYAMEKTQITGVQDRLIKNLSKGYKQRVGIAQAMLGSPEVIILDEPTVGLDPIQIIEIRDLIKSLAEEHTVILSSHILSEVSAVCNYVMIIAHGRLIASDTIENLSTYLVGSNVLHMTVRGDLGRIRMAINALAEKAKTIRYEENTEEKTDTYNIDIETDRTVDLRELSFRTFVDENCVILKMFTEAIGLEDVFLKLTTEDDEDYREELAEAELDARENAFAPDAPADEDSDDSEGGDDDDDSSDDDYKPMFS